MDQHTSNSERKAMRLLACVAVFWSIFVATTTLMQTYGELRAGAYASSSVQKNNVDAPLAMHTSSTVAPSLMGSTTLPTISVDRCREITKPGKYILSRSLYDTTDEGACISIHDTKDVALSCGGRSIVAKGISEAIRVENVKNFRVETCTFAIDEGVQTTLYVASSSDGVFRRNTINGFLSTVIDSQRLTIDENVFHSVYQQFFTHHSRITNNRAAAALDKDMYTSPASVFLSAYGTDTIISSNIIDGSAPEGNFEIRVGADEAIFIQDESGAVIEKNVMSDIWDCGIETSGKITNSRIEGNTINNAGFCGIGAWYYNTWIHNIVRNNQVSDTYQLFDIHQEMGYRPSSTQFGHLVPADEHTLIFKDNLFENNSFVRPREGNEPNGGDRNRAGSFLIIPPGYVGEGQTMPKKEEIVASNNIFKNNNFGTQDPLFIEPLTLAVDGGGNICVSEGATDFPITCLSGSPESSDASGPENWTWGGEGSGGY